MEELIELMKKVLADAFAFRLKAQYYHWNIEGPDFVQYHDFLGKLYETADENIDAIAEHIRALGAYAPGSFKRYQELSTIEDEDAVPAALEMINRISADNKKLHESFMAAHAAADSNGQRGIVNFLEGLIDDNEKTQWMLNSVLKRQ
jgi:starvation-inducible DNA-binding protein